MSTASWPPNPEPLTETVVVGGPALGAIETAARLVAVKILGAALVAPATADGAKPPPANTTAAAINNRLTTPVPARRQRTKPTRPTERHHHAPDPKPVAPPQPPQQFVNIPRRHNVRPAT